MVGNYSQVLSLLTHRSLTNYFTANNEMRVDLLHVAVGLLKHIDSTIDARIRAFAVTKLRFSDQIQVVVVLSDHGLS